MTRQTKLSLVKSLSVRLRGPYRYHNILLSKVNSDHVKSVFMLWSAIWLDLPGSTYSSFCRLQKILNTVDVELLMQSCDMVINLIRQGEDETYDRFKAHLTQLGCPCMSLIGSCKPGLQQWFLGHDYTALKAVYSFFSFPQRLHLIDPALEDRAEEKFLSCQATEEVRLTSDERSIITSWFPRTEGIRAIKYFKAHFSSGSSKVGKPLYKKYRDLTYTPRYHYNECLLRKDPDYQPETFFPEKSGKDDVTCKVLFVPKSHKAYRMVSLEPTVLTWIANGWADAIRQYLYEVRSPFLRRYSFSSDKNNAALARVGSATGKFVTIDLSSASDSITIAHFKHWFRDSWLYGPGLLCRAKKAELRDGRVIDLNTFMGMGSRLCFVFETIVFSAIVEAAIKSSGGDPVRSSYRVYGDDIVVEKRYADAVLVRLAQLGFCVNPEKTFVGTGTHIFRESCGGEYLDGFDISPVRIPRVNFSCLPSVSRVKPSHFQGLIDLSNSLSMFPSARHLIIDELRAFGPLPFFGEGGIKSPTASNFDKVTRYNDNYQYFEIEYTDVVTVPIRGRDGRKIKHDHFALAEWLRRANGRERLLFPEDRVEVEMIPPQTCRLVRKHREA